MIKQVLKSFYQILPRSFQQKILQYNIQKMMKGKQGIIEEYQKKYGCNILIETGTFLGDMVEAQQNNFKKIYSIELQNDLAEKARQRFLHTEHIKILQGDSGKLLRKILAEIDEPAIFWLDAHYSGGITAKGDKDCPIYEELDAIFEKNSNHILLIDDARYFNGEGDYPDINSLTEYIRSKDARYKMLVKDDVIRFMI